MSTPGTTAHSVFDALFVRLLQARGAFKDELRTAGFDPDHPESRYPTPVWLATLDIAARYFYPELSREEAHHRLGQRFADHYLTTILGRLTRAVALALGASNFLMLIPKIVPFSSTGVTATAKKVGPGEFVLVYTGEPQSPDFVAGALEGGAQDVRLFNLRAQVVRREAREFELRVTGVNK